MPRMLIVNRTYQCDCPDVIVHFDRFAEPEYMRIGEQYHGGDWDSCPHGSEVREATPADLFCAFIAAFDRFLKMFTGKGIEDMAPANGEGPIEADGRKVARDEPVPAE